MIQWQLIPISSGKVPGIRLFSKLTIVTVHSIEKIRQLQRYIAEF